MNSNGNFRTWQRPYGNPLANALVVVVGVLAVAASFVIGLVALVFLGAAIVVLAAIVGIRLWWFNRRMAKQMSKSNEEGPGPATSHSVIEGEYLIVRQRDENDSR